MFHILGFLFVIIVVILVIGLSIIGTVLRNPTEKQLPLEMISIENTKNFSLKMKENTWILKKLKSNQIFAMPVRMYLPLRLFSFI